MSFKMNDFRRDVLSFEHENKEYLEKRNKIFSDLFEEEDRLEKEFFEKYPDYRGLDGPLTSALGKAQIKYLKKFKELRKVYGIDE